MTPTSRCAGLLALMALAGLALPIWVSVAGVLAVLGATIADGLAVREPPLVERRLHGALARGVPCGISVTARTRDARRVLLRQPASAALAVHVERRAGALEGTLVPLRRGRHELPGIASASVGAWSLARWHHPVAAPSELLVYPDLPTARRLTLRLRAGRAAPGGPLRRGPLGLGTDFESIRDYSPDDDIRQVNWRASARMGRTMSNQYRVEQDHEVMCLLDSGRLMSAPLAQGTLLDAALDATTAVALAADELGDRCGALGFDAGIRRTVTPHRLGGRRVVRALFDLQPTLTDSDFERAFLQVGGSRRGLVLVFTDLIDERAARSLVAAAPMLTRRHAVVVASVSDPVLEADAQPTNDRAEELAAMSVRRARDAAAGRIRRTGAQVLIAPFPQLPEACVRAYLRAKARARL